MGRKVDVDQLVGALEVAQRMGSTRRALVTDWQRRHDDFPAPVVKLSAGSVWVWADVEKWAVKKGLMEKPT